MKTGSLVRNESRDRTFRNRRSLCPDEERTVVCCRSGGCLPSANGVQRTCSQRSIPPSLSKLNGAGLCATRAGEWIPISGASLQPASVSAVVRVSHVYPDPHVYGRTGSDAERTKQQVRGRTLTNPPSKPNMPCVNVKKCARVVPVRIEHRATDSRSCAPGRDAATVCTHLIVTSSSQARRKSGESGRSPGQPLVSSCLCQESSWNSHVRQRILSDAT